MEKKYSVLLFGGCGQKEGKSTLVEALLGCDLVQGCSDDDNFEFAFCKLSFNHKSPPIPTQPTRAEGPVGGPQHKSRLLEYCQKKAWPLPEIVAKRVGGPDHMPTFEATIVHPYLTGPVTARGGGKKKTEFEAARLCCEKWKIGEEIPSLNSSYTVPADDDNALSQHKRRLMEHFQKLRKPLPLFSSDKWGTNHFPIWETTVTHPMYPGKVFAEKSTNKKQSEFKASLKFLNFLEGGSSTQTPTQTPITINTNSNSNTPQFQVKCNDIPFENSEERKWKRQFTFHDIRAICRLQPADVVSLLDDRFEKTDPVYALVCFSPLALDRSNESILKFLCGDLRKRGIPVGLILTNMFSDSEAVSQCWQFMKEVAGNWIGPVQETRLDSKTEIFIRGEFGFLAKVNSKEDKRRIPGYPDEIIFPQTNMEHVSYAILRGFRDETVRMHWFSTITNANQSLQQKMQREFPEWWAEMKQPPQAAVQSESIINEMKKIL